MCDEKTKLAIEGEFRRLSHLLRFIYLPLGWGREGSPSARIVIFKLYCESESPKGLVKQQSSVSLGSTHRIPASVDLGWA